jgi:predicted RNA-binding protein associated with RNAse of E/G family
MFVADDILLFPVRSILWIFRELYNAAQEEVVNESETLTNQLSELYMALETGRITEEEFDRQEKEILDRLDAIEAGQGPVTDDSDQ